MPDPMISDKIYPIDVSSAYSMPGRFATNCIIQFSETEIVLCFFETKSWIFTGNDPGEYKRFQEQATFLPAECIARIILTPERASEFGGLIAEAGRTSLQLRADKSIGEPLNAKQITDDKP